MVHVLDNPVDGAGQLTGLIQRVQVAEMSACLIAGQGMLNVFADRCIDVSPCGLIIPEGGVLGVDIFIIKSKLTGPQRPAIADIFINAVDPQQAAVFPVWDEGGVDGLCPVVELLIHRQPKTEGVRTGEDDLHSHRRKHIGEESRRIDEIPHQGDLINEYIAEARIEQFFQIPVYHGHGIASAGFDIGRAAEILSAHSVDGLPEHGSLSGPAQAKNQADPVAFIAVEIILQLPKAVTEAPAFYALRHGGQSFTNNYTGFKVQLWLAHFGHLGLQLFQLCLQSFALLYLLLQRLQFAIPQILAVLLPIFCPLMIVARLSVDRLLGNIADGKGGDLPLQFLNLFFHTAPPFC